jgi:dihydrofolate reductase
MGRKTHESIGRVLPGRLNIIISRNLHYKVEGAEVVGSLDSAIKLAGRSEKHEAFIIGGDSIYEIALPQTDKIYLTDVHAKIDGDKFFKYNPGEWHIVSKESHLPDEKNKYAYDFITMERVNTG